MYERFLSFFQLDEPVSPPKTVQMGNAALAELFSRFAGGSFNRGVYRIANAESIDHANRFIAVAYPDLKGATCPFAFDWQGAIYSVDHRDPSGKVFQFGMADMNVLKSPYDIEQFHDTLLLDPIENVLRSDNHEHWIAAHPQSIRYGECVTHITPTWMGALDTIDNMEIVPLFDHWKLMAKLISQVRQLPPDVAPTEIVMNYRTGEVIVRVKKIAMFGRFEKTFIADNEVVPTNNAHFPNLALNELLNKYGGCSFNQGLYRVLNDKMQRLANEYIQLAFPNYSGKAYPFACDWNANVFAVSPNDASSNVVIFEPGSGECLISTYPLLAFHDCLADESAELLKSATFHAWLSKGGVPLKYTQSATYKRPLFLGGKDDLVNLELSDTEVYWHLFGQLRAKTRNLPPGTKVNISLSN